MSDVESEALPEPQPWVQAWRRALYGPDGFYRRAEGPGGHFATSAQGIPGVDEVLAQALVALAEDCDAEVIVDFACGRGELLAMIARYVGDPDEPVEAATSAASGMSDASSQSAGTVELVGVDVVERPAALPDRVTWVRSDGDAAMPSLDVLAGRRALVVAHEWLDVVACVVAEADHDGTLREVLVTRDGNETLGATLADDDARWAARHAPPLPWAKNVPIGENRPHSMVVGADVPAAGTTPDDAPDAGPARYEPGERVEIGRTRDDAWAALVDEVARHAARGSVVIGVDYAYARDARPPLGTLTGFRDGAECPPAPDGSCDVTAHVALDSLDVDDVRTQREVLLDLFGTAPLDPVPIALATSDPPAYLARLATRSALATATDPRGLGAFAWFTRTIR